MTRFVQVMAFQDAYRRDMTRGKGKAITKARTNA